MDCGVSKLGWFIYHLTDSTGAVRYVGRSTNPYARMITHWREGWYSTSGSYRVYVWIGDELHAGRVPQLLIVGRCDTELEAIEAERAEMLRLLSVGCNLVNTIVKGVKPMEAPQPNPPRTWAYVTERTQVVYGRPYIVPRGH